MREGKYGAGSSTELAHTPFSFCWSPQSPPSALGSAWEHQIYFWPNQAEIGSGEIEPPAEKSGPRGGAPALILAWGCAGSRPWRAEGVVPAATRRRRGKWHSVMREGEYGAGSPTELAHTPFSFCWSPQSPPSALGSAWEHQIYFWPNQAEIGSGEIKPPAKKVVLGGEGLQR